MRIGTDVTEADFLRAILAEPEDDTHRLVYADWLDEHAAAVPCARCIDGLYLGDTSTDQPTDAIPCSRCSGTGRVPDGRAARAEFVRAQCELAALDPVVRKHAHGAAWWEVSCTGCNRYDALRRRERELLKAHGAPWLPDTLPGAARFLSGSPGFRVFGGASDVDLLFRRGFVEEVTGSAGDWLAHGDAIRAAAPVTRCRFTSLSPRDRIRFYTRFFRAGGKLRRLGRRPADDEHLYLALGALWPGVSFELPGGER